MISLPLVKQIIRDQSGQAVAVIVPIAEYQQLVSQTQQPVPEQTTVHADHPLYGALSHLGPITATTEEIDETLRELWSAWDREDHDEQP